jgi:hypothetical protein
MNFAMTVRAERNSVPRVKSGSLQETLAANMVSGEPPARMAINATIAVALAHEFAPASQAAPVRRTFGERAMKARERRFDRRYVGRWQHYSLQHALTPLHLSRKVFVEHRPHDEAAVLNDRIAVSAVLHDNPRTV